MNPGRIKRQMGEVDAQLIIHCLICIASQKYKKQGAWSKGRKA
jgi:hypothetical protein